MNREEILYEQMSELYDIAMEGIFQKWRDKREEKKRLETEKRNKEYMEEIIPKIPSGKIYRRLSTAEVQKIMPWIKKEIVKISNDPATKQLIAKLKAYDPALTLEISYDPKIDDNDDYHLTVEVFKDVYKLFDILDEKHRDSSSYDRMYSETLDSLVNIRKRMVADLQRYPELKDYHFSVISNNDDVYYDGMIEIDGKRIKSPSELEGLDPFDYREVTGNYDRF